MNIIPSFIDRGGLGAFAASLMAGVLLAATRPEAKPCTVLTTVCAANPSGMPLCSTQRCPGERPCCKATNTNESGSGVRIRLGGRPMYCNT